jgi:hypothetical protein
LLGDEFELARNNAALAREVAAKLIRQEDKAFLVIRQAAKETETVGQPFPLTKVGWEPRARRSKKNLSAAHISPSMALRLLNQQEESPHSEASVAFALPARVEGAHSCVTTQLSPSMALRRLNILSSEGENPTSEASFAFGCPPRVKGARLLHRHAMMPASRTLPSLLDPPTSDEQHSAWDDNKEEAGTTSPVLRRAPLFPATLSPAARSMNPSARHASRSPTARRGSLSSQGSFSPAARQEPLSSTFVGTSEREEILTSLLARLSSAPLPSSPLAKKGVLSSGYGKLRAIKALEHAAMGDQKAAEHGAVFARRPPQPLVIT